MRNAYAWGTLATILLVTLLTLPKMNTSLWTDEERTLWYAGAVPVYGPVPLTENVTRVAENLWQAPGYFLVMAGWGRVFGWGEFPMRLFSLYAGLLALAVIYRMGKQLFSAEAGFYAAFTLGVSAFTINFLHDMRTYTLNVLLAALLLWAYWQVATVKRPGAWYGVLIVSAAGLLYTHYFNAFAVAALGLYHLLFRYRQGRFWQVIACFAVAGVLFLPWFGVLISAAQYVAVDDRTVSNLSSLQVIDQLLQMFSNEARGLMVLLAVLAVRPLDANRRFVAFWVGGAVLLAIVASRIVPALTEIKYMIFVFPGLALVAGAGIAGLRQLRVAPVLVLVLWGALAVWNLNDAGAQERIQSWTWQVPLKELTEAIDGRTLPEDAVLFHLGEGAEEANRNEMMDYYMHPFEIVRGVLIPANDATPDDLYFERVLEGAARANRVWLSYEIGRRSWRVGPTQETVLPEAGYLHCGTAPTHSSVQLELYAQRPNRDFATTFVTETSAEIDLFVLAPTRYLPEQSVEINVGWRVVDDILPGQHSVAVQIEHTDGTFITSADYGIPTNDFGCVLDQIALGALPPGDYVVRATVYNWSTGERLTSLAAAADGERPIIGTFTVR